MFLQFQILWSTSIVSLLVYSIQQHYIELTQKFYGPSGGCLVSSPPLPSPLLTSRIINNETSKTFKHNQIAWSTSTSTCCLLFYNIVQHLIGVRGGGPAYTGQAGSHTGTHFFVGVPRWVRPSKRLNVQFMNTQSLYAISPSWAMGADAGNKTIISPRQFIMRGVRDLRPVVAQGHKV